MLPNVMPPVVEDSCLSPMMDRAIVRGFGYGGNNISPRARCTTRMAVVADRRRIPDRPASARRPLQASHAVAAPNNIGGRL